eukprot:GHVH01015902.1.p1 GENE.GHVH01015902.1~~GHVH01015902.1.p1  ORF type:complete len:481 (-),score=46.20 GHVH01015902.1:83-1525(-)
MQESISDYRNETVLSERLQANYDSCIESLTWSLESAKYFVDRFDAALQEAIVSKGEGEAHVDETSSLKAIDTFCNAVPSGAEIGNHYAVVLGCTTMRILCVKLHGNGKASVVERSQNIRETRFSHSTPKGLLDKKTPAVAMFDCIAKLTKELMFQIGDDPASKRNVAFSFSFPVEQRSLSSATLTHWTKEFETGNDTHDRLEGRDVGEVLDCSFSREGMGATVSAIINDTVGTLLAGGYENNKKLPTCRVGVVLSTGFNISSFDPLAKNNGFVGSYVNYECGNYSGASAFDSVMDRELDCNSTSRKHQLTEKIISGHYLGEICRIAFLKVFQYRCSQNVWKRWSFGTDKAASIYGDNTKRYKITHCVMKECFDWNLTSDDELRMVYKIVCAVFDRSATVAALMTAVMSNRTRFLQKSLGGVTVAVTGTLYLKNVKYRKTFRKTLDKILGGRSELLHVVSVDDGTGMGAATLAGCQSNPTT